MVSSLQSRAYPLTLLDVLHQEWLLFQMDGTPLNFIWVKCPESKRKKNNFEIVNKKLKQTKKNVGITSSFVFNASSGFTALDEMPDYCHNLKAGNFKLGRAIKQAVVHLQSKCIIQAATHTRTTTSPNGTYTAITDERKGCVCVCAKVNG